MKNKTNKYILIALLTGALQFSPGVIQAQEKNTVTEKDSRSKIQQKKKEQSEEKRLQKEKKDPENIILHNEITVTATRTETTVFDTPKPVSVILQKNIKEKAPNNLSELLPEMPGTDMVGVGANQSRPIIRGLRGQRILLLSDGIRLSNSRRTQTFGEIPSLIDISATERIEVVRGPASVLYGSEAIGGVINIISQVPDYNRSGSSISGSLGLRYDSGAEQSKVSSAIRGNFKNLGFMLSGAYQNAGSYFAPAGSFGDITLQRDTELLDSGVKDNNLNLFLGYRIAQNHDLSFKYERYEARDTGFGYIDPVEYSPGDPTIQLLYPKQNYNKVTLKYENHSLQFVLADRLSLIGYYFNNKRDFNTNITIPFYPGAGMKIQSNNFTDVGTLGLRAEMTKVLFNTHILTYGFDLYQDSSENTDVNVTEMFGFGPAFPRIDEIPKVPNAIFRSAGLFLQDQINLFSRTSLLLGLRYQNVYAQTRETQGVSEPEFKSQDDTLVGAANIIFGLTDDLNLIFSLGRGFRSPNLPERFFQGVTPDGRGFQIRNLNLKSETSLNMDFGLRWRWQNLYIESSIFRNMIYGGIQIAPTGNNFSSLIEYQNVNVDKLRLQGAEFLGQYEFNFGLSLIASFSTIATKNLTNPELMNADTYGSRMNLNLRYTFPKNIVWMEYHLRHNGDRKDIDLGNNPIGSIIPGFTVHTLRMGLNLFQNSSFPQQIGIIFGNLSNTLYSEFSNASFFRPAPRRHIMMTWSTRF